MKRAPSASGIAASIRPRSAVASIELAAIMGKFSFPTTRVAPYGEGRRQAEIHENQVETVAQDQQLAAVAFPRETGPDRIE